ncbi:hypothetical protein [Nocardioides sp. LML1-1-1.1]|uniref:hypothetical protein n=1 Tax=Nocardioides sp. LML1-1-1.1 TaxID=3135248 RepID=UPI00343F0079
MIFDAIVTIIAGIARGIASLFGSLPAPTWIGDFGSAWGSFVGLGASLDPWVPWNLLVTVVTAILACVAVSLGVKMVRIVLSLFTGGGGSAA